MFIVHEIKPQIRHTKNTQEKKTERTTTKANVCGS